jgi:hypothetical protein
MQITSTLYVILFTTAIICSCSEPPIPPEFKANAHTSDSILKEIPPDRLTPEYKDLAATILDKLNLPSIENGVDGFELRVWIAVNQQEHLVIVRQVDSVWSADVSELTFIYDDEYDSLLTIARMKTGKTPSSGWPGFLQKLVDTEILKLPDFRQVVTDYALPTDAGGVTVEWANRNKYRIFSYPDLESTQTLSAHAAKMEKAIRMLEQELNFKRPSLY